VTAGAERVIISAPATGADLTVCMGVNDDRFDPGCHRVISNASCTTNCLAPMVWVLHEHFGIATGFMSTVHAYTNDQNLLDLPHRGHTRDPRRARAAAQNIVPSSTGAARAIGQVIPELAGRLDGVALRVPVADASLTDLVCELERPATRDEINDAFREAAAGERFRGVMAVTEQLLVSADIVGNPHSCVFSEPDTMARGRHAKVFGWYDNEWAYANRLLELAALVGAPVSAPPQPAATRAR
jgi:glyceraldehyde 3-phosphate dehydrogenase